MKIPEQAAPLAMLLTLTIGCYGDPPSNGTGELSLGTLHQSISACSEFDVELANCVREWGQLEDGEVVIGIDGVPSTVEYKLLGIFNPVAFADGDIILGDLNSLEQIDANNPTEGVARISNGSLWPQGRVPFEISPFLPEPERVDAAIQHWESRTALRFVERQGEEDFVRFQDSAGCSSFVGRVGGMQPVNLNVGCSVGNAIHEIGHAIGLWHEQSRSDRDEFVTVNLDNVLAGSGINFNVIEGVGADNGNVSGYNFNSIMHYPATAFAVDPSIPTISLNDGISLLPGVVMGQRAGLSNGDVTAATLIYCEEDNFPCVIPAL